MKYLLAFILGCALITASAQDRGFGLGVIVGEPTGISVKGWISDERAVDGALAWSLFGHSWFSAHTDYLFHNMRLININQGKLPLYYGPGLRLRSWTGGRYWEHGRWHSYNGGRAALGVRFPVGLAYLPDKAPVDIFLELVPTLDLVPSSSFDITGAIGVRYWFR